MRNDTVTECLTADLGQGLVIFGELDCDVFDGQCRAFGFGARFGPWVDPVVMEIKDRRDITLEVPNVKFDDVGGPLGVFDSGLELAIQHVLSRLPTSQVVSSPATDRALQSEPAHELQHGLLRQFPSLSQEHGQDASMPISASRP